MLELADTGTRQEGFHSEICRELFGDKISSFSGFLSIL